jgi:serine/threonine protein kinase
MGVYTISGEQRKSQFGMISVSPAGVDEMHGAIPTATDGASGAPVLEGLPQRPAVATVMKVAEPTITMSGPINGRDGAARIYKFEATTFSGETKAFVGKCLSARAHSAEKAVEDAAKQDDWDVLNQEAIFHCAAGDHENIAKVVGMAVQSVDGEDEPMMLMEFVDGLNSNEVRLAMQAGLRNGHVRYGEFCGMEAAIRHAELKAIAQWTRNDIVHCDLKLQNVMIDKKGDAKIIDFGLAVVAGQPGLGSGYLKAPEQFASEQEQDAVEESKCPRVGPHTDPFAVGASTLLVFEGDENGLLDAYDPAKRNSFSEERKSFEDTRGDSDVLGGSAESSKRLPNTGLYIDREIRKDKAGNVIRTRGVFAAETALTRFIDLTMKKRCTAEEALKEPFITDAVVDADAAKPLLAKVVEKARDRSIFLPKIGGSVSQVAGDPHTPVNIRGIATLDGRGFESNVEEGPTSYAHKKALFKAERAGGGTVRRLSFFYNELSGANSVDSEAAQIKPAKKSGPSARS